MSIVTTEQLNVRNCQEMLKNGYMLIPFPPSIVRSMMNHVRAYIGCKNDEDLTASVMKYSDEEFVHKFNKPLRMFPEPVTEHVMSWVKSMASFLGGSETAVNYVCEEEIKGNPQLNESSYDIFWRCVRPGKSDVGAPHCDFQFWEIAKGTPLEPKSDLEYDERWKIWLPLSGCVQGNSLEVIPGSHNEEIPIDYIMTKNGLRPNIKESWLQEHSQEFICPFTEFQNCCVLFHDKLVHRGPSNNTPHLRVSGEMTILLKL